MGRRFLLIDGHPDAERLSGHLLDLYQQALPAGTALERIAIRDLDFDANLARGYHDIPPLEPDLPAAAEHQGGLQAGLRCERSSVSCGLRGLMCTGYGGCRRNPIG